MISLVLFGTILTNSAFAAQIQNQTQPRGIISDFISGSRPGNPNNAIGHGSLIGPSEHDDGCRRQYPFTPEGPQQVPFAFNRYALSPEIIADPPNNYLEVEYEHISECQPRLGNEVDVCSTIAAPSTLNWNCHSERLYTLLLIDVYPLGYNDKPLLSQGILWWVVDIPGCDIEEGTTLYEYQMPLPLCGSGQDKYVFLVYEQPQYDVDWSEEAHVTAT